MTMVTALLTRRFDAPSSEHHDSRTPNHRATLTQRSSFYDLPVAPCIRLILTSPPRTRILILDPEQRGRPSRLDRRTAQRRLLSPLFTVHHERTKLSNLGQVILERLGRSNAAFGTFSLVGGLGGCSGPQERESMLWPIWMEGSNLS